MDGQTVRQTCVLHQAVSTVFVSNLHDTLSAFYFVELKADPDMDFVPRTVIIGGKVEPVCCHTREVVLIGLSLGCSWLPHCKTDHQTDQFHCPRYMCSCLTKTHTRWVDWLDMDYLLDTLEPVLYMECLGTEGNSVTDTIVCCLVLVEGGSDQLTHIGALVSKHKTVFLIG